MHIEAVLKDLQYLLNCLHKFSHQEAETDIACRDVHFPPSLIPWRSVITGPRAGVIIEAHIPTSLRTA